MTGTEADDVNDAGLLLCAKRHYALLVVTITSVGLVRIEEGIAD
jgi:hypothetical protein